MSIPPVRVLVINPNTSANMTVALEPAIESLGYQGPSYEFTYFTCPSTPSSPGLPSINSPADAAVSAATSLPHLLPLLSSHDVFLVACYSHHPLVAQLQAALEDLASREGSMVRRRHVTGIFEASVTASLIAAGRCGPRAGFGIVSTGKVWEEALAEATAEFLGADQSLRFVSCETTGLNADQLHAMPVEEVRSRMREATKRLVAKAVARGVLLRAVCLGCAGMVGLEESVRMALLESMGETEAVKVCVVDGVKAGVGELIMLSRGGF